MKTEGRNVAVVVALDGPAAAGKSTVGRAIARRLGFSFVETGKLYRVLALIAVRDKLPLDDGPRLAGAFNKADVRYTVNDGEPLVTVGGEDVTGRLAGWIYFKPTYVRLDLDSNDRILTAELCDYDGPGGV